MPSQLKFHYQFRFQNGVVRTIPLVVDEHALTMIADHAQEPPEWTRLDLHQCSGCPLDPADHPHCPIAVHLSEIVEAFHGFNSYDEVEVEVTVKERRYLKQTTLQQSLGNLAGIVMATAGCPILEPLRPMVRFHLPFASMEETEFRMVSMYLVAQYLKQKNGQEPDWSLEGLDAIYKRIKQVNIAFARRVKSASTTDASVNAIIILDCFANAVPFAIRTRMGSYETSFRSYLD